MYPFSKKILSEAFSEWPTTRPELAETPLPLLGRYGAK
jgi:hypothetical protein